MAPPNSVSSLALALGYISRYKEILKRTEEARSNIRRPVWQVDKLLQNREARPILRQVNAIVKDPNTVEYFPLPAVILGASIRP